MASSRVRLLAPLGVRDFALLWAGQTVSLAGNGMFTVALTWQALALPEGARGLSVVLIAMFLPSTLLLLAGGVVGDRRSRRTTMLVCDAAQAVSVGCLAVLAATGQVRLWHLVAVAVLAGAASGFFLPASTALVPEVLPREHLVAANSLNTVSRLTAARLAGPALGGVVVSLAGTGAAFAADAGTFAVSAVTLFALRARAAPARSAPASVRSDLREGVAYCLTRRWLAVSLLAFAVLNLCVTAPLAVLVPVYVKEHLRLGPEAFGLLLAVEGLSGGIAAVAAAQAPAPRRYVVATHLSFAAAGLSLALMATTGALSLALGCLAVAGFLLELGNVYWMTALQQHVPGALLGRVSSVDWLMSGSLIPVGMAVVATAAAATGVAAVFAVGGGAAALTGALAAVALRARDPGAAP
jgi:DHA3 family tetracycline resistance protein-like MFS transporter